MIAATHAASLIPLVMILVAVVIIFGSVAVCIALVWDREPWFRKTPKPSRIYRNAREQVKTWKIKQKYPEAFPDGKVEDSL